MAARPTNSNWIFPEATTALALTKDALNASLASSLDSMLELEAAAQGVAGTSAYARECFRRFAAKERGMFQWPASDAS